MRWLFFSMAILSLAGVIVFHLLAPHVRATIAICRPQNGPEATCVYDGQELVYWTNNPEDAELLVWQMNKKK